MSNNTAANNAAAAAAAAAEESASLLPGTYLCSKCGQIKKGHICPEKKISAFPSSMGGNMPNGIASTSGISTGIDQQVMQGAMATRRANLHLQQIIQQQQQQQRQNDIQIQQFNTYQQFLLEQHASSSHYSYALTPEQKKAREKNASDFNSILLLERQERYPHYFDPHTKTIQVISSWGIRVSDKWEEIPEADKNMINQQNQQMVNNRYMFLQQQRDIHEIQKEMLMSHQKQEKQLMKYHEMKEQRKKKIDEAIENIQRPRSNVSAYFHYMNINREDEKKLNPDVPLSDISKILGAKWKQLSPDEQREYYDRAKEDKIRFEHEMQQYNLKCKEIAESFEPLNFQGILESPPTSQSQQFAQQAQKQYQLQQAQALQQQQAQQAQAQQQQQQAQVMLQQQIQLQQQLLIQQQLQQQQQSFEQQTTTTTTSNQQQFQCEQCESNDVDSNLMTCSKCDKKFHSKCLKLHQKCVDSYNSSKKDNTWKCVDCKDCQLCSDSNHDDKMLFCDVCDRGFHTFCLVPPLSSLPEGGWRCNDCVFCVHCYTKQPTTNSPKPIKWRENYTCCDSCYSKGFTKVKHCSVCRNVLKEASEEEESITECLYCHKSVHDNCDSNITDNLENEHFTYSCPSCTSGKQIIPSPIIGAEEKPSSKKSSSLGKRKKKDDDVNVDE